jgi:hypothetical protein
MAYSNLKTAKSSSIMGSRHYLRRWLPIGLILWLLAAATRFWIAPQWERLPADYAVEIKYAARGRYRDTPQGAWQKYDLVVRRVDQTLVASADDAVIQGDIHWTTQTGEVSYESAGIYGVDRRTRANLSGYGNVQRAGQFLFPPHVQPKNYQLWDPFYTGARSATFVEATTLEGMHVYVFDCQARDIDDTPGYSFLADVPERYHAYSAGGGKMWVEPISGIVVDFEDSGKSYFGHPGTGKWISDFHFYDARHTHETKSAQFQRAAAIRFRSRALEVWLPAALVLSGLMCLVLGLRRSSSSVSHAAFTGGSR